MSGGRKQGEVVRLKKRKRKGREERGDKGKKDEQVQRKAGEEKNATRGEDEKEK